MSNTEAVERTWRALEGAARDYAATGDMSQAKSLAVAAEAYTRARWAANTGKAGTKPSEGRGALSGVVVPFGRSKGVAIEEADAKDLRWVANALGQSIDNPDKARWRDDNERVLDAIQKELGTR